MIEKKVYITAKRNSIPHPQKVKCYFFTYHDNAIHIGQSLRHCFLYDKQFYWSHQSSCSNMKTGHRLNVLAYLMYCTPCCFHLRY